MVKDHTGENGWQADIDFKNDPYHLVDNYPEMVEMLNKALSWMPVIEQEIVRLTRIQEITRMNTVIAVMNQYFHDIPVITELDQKNLPLKIQHEYSAGPAVVDGQINWLRQNLEYLTQAVKRMTNTLDRMRYEGKGRHEGPNKGVMAGVRSESDLQSTVSDPDGPSDTDCSG